MAAPLEDTRYWCTYQRHCGNGWVQRYWSTYQRHCGNAGPKGFVAKAGTTNPKTGGHRFEERVLRHVTPQELFNTAGVFTCTLALPCGALEVDVARTSEVTCPRLSGTWPDVQR